MSLNDSPPRKKSGFRAALEFTGIPPSWFDKRPRLPSRNWLIFLSVTQSFVAFYVYDRHQSKKIRQEYVDKVKHLAAEPLHSLDFPRTVTVYSAKWPGDDDWDRGSRYFRKYVKPIFVAAAVDYTVVAGKRHGDLATRVANDIKTERRIALGLDAPQQSLLASSIKGTLDARRRRALDGGTIIVGRPAFKEYMAGLRRGWTDSLELVDKDEQLSRELESDGHFDEPETSSSLDPSSTSSSSADFADGEPLPTPSRLPPSRAVPGLFPPLSAVRPSSPSASAPAQTRDAGADVSPPTQIPPQPPLLLVPFVNLVGLKLVPLMIWDFFNERQKVRAGAEAAYRLVSRATRPLERAADIVDFDVSAESYYKSSTAAFPAEVQKARAEYYKTLPEKLATARALARGEREPTKLETEAPPPTEVELRAERLKKETRWKADERGWNLVSPDTPVEWDERWEGGALEVFVDPPESHWE
ncbi:inner membrane protein import complex subunit Tim54-domain-containing protein [Lactarius deliciosus]|nr:inner membrane protein import complex subunit Tim54-domain-containing protein [Lactarius deliciosus]